MKLPRYTAKTPPPRETGLVRAQDIGALTRTGGQEFEAMQQMGGAMQKAAGLGFQAYMNRQALDDHATMGEISKRATDASVEATNAVTMFDPSVGDALPNDPKNYYDGTKVNRFDNPQKEAFINTTYKDYEAKILNLAKGIKNPKTRQAWINSQLPEAYERITVAANAKLQEYQEQLILSNAKTAASNGDMETANEWIDIAEKHGLIGPKRAAAERENNVEEYVTGLYRAGLHDEARKVLEASSLSATKKEQLDDEIDTDERSVQVKLAADLKVKQNETALNLLLSLWDGTLTDDSLRQATESGLLTIPNAKGLRESLTNPKTFNLASYIQVKNAVNSYERGRTSFDDTLAVLTANASLLGDQGKGLTDRLFAIPNKNEADWENEALDYIESQILEKDIYGRFYGTPKEQTAALEARLAYDVALEEAERKGEPIEGRDKLIKAHEIMLKYRPEKEEKPPVELEEGLGTVPFVSDSDIDKAIRQAKENLGEKTTPQDIKAEVLRLLR